MPYVRPEERLNHDLRDKGYKVKDVGTLNFAITTLILGYLERSGKNYSNINSVIGVLECSKQELYRRMASPYEDIKIKENGDVY